MKSPTFTLSGRDSVSVMRRHLAQLLSKLKGEDYAEYTFKVKIGKPIARFPKGD